MGSSAAANPCPTCGEEGKFYEGSARAEQDHYLSRTLWDLHKLRQALGRGGNDALHDIASIIINHVEYLAALMREWRTH